MKKDVLYSDLPRIGFRFMDQSTADTTVAISFRNRKIIQVYIICFRIMMNFNRKIRNNVFILRNKDALFSFDPVTIKAAGLIPLNILRMIDRLKHFYK